MSKHTKINLFVIILAVVSISIIVYRYEFLLKELGKQQTLGVVKGGAPSNKIYTAGEIISLIKGSKEYIGDSVTIFDNGNMLTSNSKFQGTLNAVINSKDNMNIVRSNMDNNRLPLQYNIYILAASYYRQQYPQDFRQIKNN